MPIKIRKQLFQRWNIFSNWINIERLSWRVAAGGATEESQRLYLEGLINKSYLSPRQRDEGTKRTLERSQMEIVSKIRVYRRGQTSTWRKLKSPSVRFTAINGSARYRADTGCRIRAEFTSARQIRVLSCRRAAAETAGRTRGKVQKETPAYRGRTLPFF